MILSRTAVGSLAALPCAATCSHGRHARIAHTGPQRSGKEAYPSLRRRTVCASVVTPNESNTSQAEVFARNPNTKVAKVTGNSGFHTENLFPTAQQVYPIFLSILPLMEVGVPISAKLSLFACGEQICKDVRRRRPRSGRRVRSGSK